MLRLKTVFAIFNIYLAIFKWHSQSLKVEKTYINSFTLNVYSRLTTVLEYLFVLCAIYYWIVCENKYLHCKKNYFMNVFHWVIWSDWSICCHMVPYLHPIPNHTRWILNHMNYIWLFWKWIIFKNLSIFRKKCYLIEWIYWSDLLHFNVHRTKYLKFEAEDLHKW